MPPRCAPKAYQSPGASLIRLPGCKKLRGTQVGVNRNRPAPASSARDKAAPTLSFFTVFKVMGPSKFQLGSAARSAAERVLAKGDGARRTPDLNRSRSSTE